MKAKILIYLLPPFIILKSRLQHRKRLSTITSIKKTHLTGK